MAGKFFVAIVFVPLAGIAASAPVLGETGRAAYYRGGRTASGEVSGPNAHTAAHRTLPFGTKVLLTNMSNGRSVTVRINDRGPYGRGRIIDVSTAAARELGMIGSGTARVRVDRQLARSLRNARRRRGNTRGGGGLIR
jgi:rare lipoprotein A